MTGVAGSLALSLVVTTPANAAAAVGTKDFLSAAQIRGAVAAAPVVASRAAMFGPIGIGIGAGVMLAAATSNWWVPWVSEGIEEQFGHLWAAGEGDEVANPEHTVKPPDPQLQIIDWGPGVSQDKATATLYLADGGTGFRSISGTFECRSTSGQVTTRDYGGNFWMGWRDPQAIADMKCFSTSDELIGFTLCNGGAAVDGCPPGGSEYNGPVNAVHWGTHIVATGGADPYAADTIYTVTVECLTNDGRTVSISADTAGDVGGLEMPSCAAAGLGHATGKLDIVAAPALLPAQPFYGLPAIEPNGDYPQCGPHLPGSGCKLSVWVDGKECTEGLWNCENWTRLYVDTPARIDCHYGPYLATVSDCALLERAYEVGGATGTRSNTDGDPNTRDDNDVRGQPNPNPSTGTGTGTGTGTVPGTGGSVGTIPGGASAEEGACFPTGWGMLNPIEWVYRPVSCAMVAAFQPKTDLQTRITAMSASFSDKVPMTWFGVGSGISGGACPADWAVTLNGERHSLICGTQADGIIQGFRPILGAMLAIAAVWPLIRSMFYAAIPIFKVNPS